MFSDADLKIKWKPRKVYWSICWWSSITRTKGNCWCNKIIKAKDYAQAIGILRSTVKYDSFYDYKIFKEFLKYSGVNLIDLCTKDQLNSKVSRKEKIKIRKLTKNPHLKENQIRIFLNLSFDLLHELVWNYKNRISYRANLGDS